MSQTNLIVPASIANRRRFLTGTGTALLSGVAIAMLAGNEALIRGASAAAPDDLTILNTALGLEHEAIAAYELGAKSGLLKDGTLKVAKTFQDHHKEHRDLLESTIKKMGGAPVSGKTMAEYNFPADKLKKAEDVLKFAAKLEKGAASAYLGAIPVFQSPALKTAAGRLVADESMHWVVLQNALGEGLPDALAIS
ncbi:MAG: ferritin-like domain-containing protein [Alphaproteobacteria bacterium]|nr:ferritin-like domain-containing protein [Alphaproteobacteria bacterium]